MANKLASIWFHYIRYLYEKQKIYGCIALATKFTYYITLIPLKVTRNHQFKLCIPKLLIGFVIVIITTIYNGYLLSQKAPLSVLKDNPYLIIGFIRELSYYLYMLIYAFSHFTRSARTCQLINYFREWDEVLDLGERRLMMFVLLIMGQTIAIAFDTVFLLIIRGLRFDSFKSSIWTLLNIYNSVMPESDYATCIVSVVLLQFYYEVLHEQLELVAQGQTITINVISVYERPGEV